jgi:cytochrome c553
MTSPVLALDLGTATGWALRTADGQLVSGTQSFSPAASRVAACATCASGPG